MASIKRTYYPAGFAFATAFASQNESKHILYISETSRDRQAVEVILTIWIRSSRGSGPEGDLLEIRNGYELGVTTDYMFFDLVVAMLRIYLVVQIVTLLFYTELTGCLLSKTLRRYFLQDHQKCIEHSWFSLLANLQKLNYYFTHLE